MGGAGSVPSMIKVNSSSPGIAFAVWIGTTPYGIARSALLIGSPARLDAQASFLTV
jgi:hypothetical protein